MQRDALLLDEMIDAATQAMALAAEQDADSLATDRTRRDALLWNFTVLGEASAQLSVSLRAQNESIAWNRPTQLRNRIVHGYWSVDLDVLLATAEEDLPRFTQQLRTVRAALA